MFLNKKKHPKHNNVYAENAYSALIRRICIIIIPFACQQDLVLIKSIFNAISMSSLIKLCFWGGTRHENLFIWCFYVIRTGKHDVENELETIRLIREKMSKRNGVDNNSIRRSNSSSSTNTNTYSNIEKSIIFWVIPSGCE